MNEVEIHAVVNYIDVHVMGDNSVYEDFGDDVVGCVYFTWTMTSVETSILISMMLPWINKSVKTST